VISIVSIESSNFNAGLRAGAGHFAWNLNQSAD